MKKLIAMLLAAVIFAGTFVTNVMAADSEDPLAIKNFAEFGAVPEEPKPAEETVETVPEVIPEEEAEAVENEAAIPEETVAQETFAAEEPASQIAETVAETEETIPADMVEEPIQDAEDPGEPQDEPQGHNGVPLYFQNDYPNNIYGSGTIETNGCSAASLAMVATYMTGISSR